MRNNANKLQRKFQQYCKPRITEKTDTNNLDKTCNRLRNLFLCWPKPS